MSKHTSSKPKVILIGLHGLMPEEIDRYQDRVPVRHEVSHVLQ